MIDDLKKMLKERFGADNVQSVIIDKVVDDLNAGGGMNEWTIRTFVIGTKFFEMFKGGERTARDIEEELAATHPDLTRDAVRHIRLRHAGALKK